MMDNALSDDLRQMAAQAPVGMAVLDGEGRIRQHNAAFAGLIGRDLAALTGQVFAALLHPEDRSAVDDLAQAALAGQETGARLEVRCLLPDGQPVWVRAACSPGHRPGETPRVFLYLDDCAIHKGLEPDINRIAAAQQAFRRSQQLLQLVMDTVPTRVFWKDRQLAFLGCNQAFARDAGLPNPAAIVGLTDFDLPWKALAERYRQDDQRVLETGEPLYGIEEPQQRQDGSRYWLVTTKLPLRDADGNIVGVMGTYEDITDRRQAEAALRSSEDRYRRLFEDVPISLWEEDYSGARQIIEGLRPADRQDLDAYLRANPDVLRRCIAGVQILDVNRHTLNMYGATSKQAFLGPLLAVLPEEEYDSLRQELVALAGGQHDIALENRRVINGQPRYVAVAVTLAPGYEESWERVLVSLTDITRLKQAEAAEHEQRTLAEALQTTSAALVSSLDPEVVLNRILDTLDRVVPHDAANIGLIEGDSVRIHSWRGYGELRSLQLDDLHLPLEWPTFREMILTGEPCLISDVTSHAMPWVTTPETSWVKSYIGVPIRAHGQVVGFLNLDSEHPGFFTQVHLARLQAFADQVAIAIENAQLYDEIRRHAADLQRRVESRTAELERERAQLQAILDAMGEGVVYSEDRAVRYVNDQMLNLLGFHPGSLTGSINQLLAGAMTADRGLLADDARLHDVLARRRIWRGDARLTRSDGSSFEANLTITLVGDPSDRPMAMVTVVRDVSTERALQAQKDRFIANASHELRTPIANMKMRLYLLEKQPEKRGEHLQVLHYVTDRMEALVEELLDISRFERGVITLDRRVSLLQRLIENVVSVEGAAAIQKGLTLAMELPAVPLYAFIDPKRVTQVLNNLVANAFNYTPEGGVVTIRLAQDHSEAVIAVQDTGIGIPESALEQIFEPFFRVNEEVARGTGLGLTISREIVDLHGGTLVAESIAGQGSTFTIRLPLQVDAPQGGQ